MEKQLELGLDLGLTESQKKAEELNQKAKGLKLKTQIDLQLEDKLMKKEITKLEKEITKLKEEEEIKIKDAEAKKVKQQKEKEEASKGREVLKAEGVDASKMSDKDVLKEVAILNASPKAPFKVYAPDRELEVKLVAGKRYKLDEVKAMVLKAYPDAFYLKKATATYMKEHNSVVLEMTGSRKGC